MSDPDGAKRLLGYNAEVTSKSIGSIAKVEDYRIYPVLKPKLREDRMVSKY